MLLRFKRGSEPWWESRESRLVFNEDPTEKPFRAEEVFNRLLAAPEVMGDGRW